MHTIHYDSLMNITKSTAPYRGSTNRFPTGKRSESHKYFLSDYLDGEQVFRMIYGKLHTKVDIPFDSIKQHEALGKKVVNNTTTKEVYYYNIIPHEIGIVRPDNTFEFTSDGRASLGQGVRIHIGEALSGYLYRSSRLGGTVYKSVIRDTMHPIFKGLRVNCDDFRDVPESHKYQLYTYQVNRKASRQLMAKYKTMFEVSEVMAKNISYKDIVEIAAELLLDTIGMDVTPTKAYQYLYFTNEHRNLMRERAEQLRVSAPLDALILNACRMDVSDFQPNRLIDTISTINQRPQYLRNIDPMGIVTNVKRRLCKLVYTENPEVLTRVELEAGKVYSQSDWGFLITMNGNEMQQYY